MWTVDVEFVLGFSGKEGIEDVVCELGSLDSFRASATGALLEMTLEIDDVDIEGDDWWLFDADETVLAGGTEGNNGWAWNWLADITRLGDDPVLFHLFNDALAAWSCCEASGKEALDDDVGTFESVDELLLILDSCGFLNEFEVIDIDDCSWDKLFCNENFLW